FIEVSYRGASFSGFQRQENAHTVQAELERGMEILQREFIGLTGSSRTDAGVHALQNYFHFSYAGVLHPQFLYKLNAIVHADLVVKRVIEMPKGSHCRFDAISRMYRYYIYKSKNPFLEDRAYYFPYKLD